MPPSGTGSLSSRNGRFRHAGGSWKILVVSAACGPPSLPPAGLATMGKEDANSSAALPHLLTPSDNLLSGFGSRLGAGVC